MWIDGLRSMSDWISSSVECECPFLSACLYRYSCVTQAAMCDRWPIGHGLNRTNYCSTCREACKSMRNQCMRQPTDRDGTCNEKPLSPTLIKKKKKLSSFRITGSSKSLSERQISETSRQKRWKKFCDIFMLFNALFAFSVFFSESVVDILYEVRGRLNCPYSRFGA